MSDIFQLPFPNHHYGYEFGERDELGRFHPGADFNGEGAGDADEGDSVACIGPGVVSYAESPHKTTWGNLVFVMHNMKQIFADLGVPHPDWCPDKVWSQYAHLKVVNVAIGQKMKKGQLIGLNGKTGTTKRRSWTAHLHWEVRKRALGVYYYPPRSVSAKQFHDMYFNPEEFVKKVNDHVAVHLRAKAEAQTDKNEKVQLEERCQKAEQTVVELVRVIRRIKGQTNVDGILERVPWIKA